MAIRDIDTEASAGDVQGEAFRGHADYRFSATVPQAWQVRRCSEP